MLRCKDAKSSEPERGQPLRKECITPQIIPFHKRPKIAALIIIIVVVAI